MQFQEILQMKNQQSKESMPYQPLKFTQSDSKI